MLVSLIYDDTSYSIFMYAWWSCVKHVSLKSQKNSLFSAVWDSVFQLIQEDFQMIYLAEAWGEIF